MSRAELCRFPDRFTVEYVRTFPHPIERVWRALTDAKEMSIWAMPATIDLRVGGAYTFMGEQWGEILALDPPRLIKFGKRGIDADPHALGENYMQYALEETTGGTRMTFTERWKEGPDYHAFFGDDLPGGPETPFHPGTLSGWHGMFDDLADLLDGVEPNSRVEPGPAVADWAGRKVRSGELTPEVAKRYARELSARQAHFELRDVYREHIRTTLPPATGA
jgi:uncharacterized protein YndB with AHSA1/START domain